MCGAHGASGARPVPRGCLEAAACPQGLASARLSALGLRIGGYFVRSPCAWARHVFGGGVPVPGEVNQNSPGAWCWETRAASGAPDPSSWGGSCGTPPVTVSAQLTPMSPPCPVCLDAGHPATPVSSLPGPGRLRPAVPEAGRSGAGGVHAVRPPTLGRGSRMRPMMWGGSWAGGEAAGLVTVAPAWAALGALQLPCRVPRSPQSWGDAPCRQGGLPGSGGRWGQGREGDGPVCLVVLSAPKPLMHRAG